MAINGAQLLRVTEWIIAVAVTLQTIELFQIRSTWNEKGIWTWRILRTEYPRALAAMLDPLLGDRGFRVLLVLRLGLALLSPVYANAATWIFLTLSTAAIAVRWRGTFNGGSDAMTILVLGVVSTCHLFGPEHPRAVSIAFGYLAIQVCLSYFLAGLAKLRRPNWRDGTAFAGFLASRYYAVPDTARRSADALQKFGAARWAGWGIIAFECLFPIALLDSRTCFVLILAALGFQIANAMVFGLNRFFWAWAAAYPALYATTVLLQLR